MSAITLKGGSCSGDIDMVSSTQPRQPLSPLSGLNLSFLQAPSCALQWLAYVPTCLLLSYSIPVTVDRAMALVPSKTFISCDVLTICKELRALWTGLPRHISRIDSPDQAEAGLAGPNQKEQSTSSTRLHAYGRARRWSRHAAESNSN